MQNSLICQDHKNKNADGFKPFYLNWFIMYSYVIILLTLKV